MNNYDWMNNVDLSRVSEIEAWNDGEVRVVYELPTDLTEEEIRDNMSWWCFDNIWTLFKIFRISDDFMREIQANLPLEDIKELEQEIETDCYIPRQCFPEQIENYLTYMRSCRIYFRYSLKEEQNKDKLLNRLNRMMCSWYSRDGSAATFVDYTGVMIGQIPR